MTIRSVYLICKTYTPAKRKLHDLEDNSENKIRKYWRFQ
jgi:hypothetical protein